jgi:small-conductance mechanosensitive channel
VWQQIWQMLDRELLTLGGTPVTIGTVGTALVIIITAYAISSVMQNAISSAYRSRGIGDEGGLSAIRRLTHYAIVLIGVGVALDTLGVNLGALFAAGAVFAVGLGFAIQNIAQNFVAGVILLLERSIKSGDVLEIDGLVVRVSQLGFRTALVRTRDDEDLIVPNSLLVQTAVKNYTLRDSVFRLRAGIGVVYGSDLRLVRETLHRTAQDLPWRIPDREPLILLLKFGDSSVDFEVSVWIDDPWRARIELSNLQEAIWWALKDASVTIAFPQLDVHFDPPVHDSLRALAG